VRFLPRRLKTRLVLLLLLAVAVAETLTFLLLADERRFALLTARYDELVERTVELADLLAVVPEESRPALLAAASTRDLLFVLDPRDLAERLGGEPEPGLARMLARRLHLPSAVVHVRVATALPRPLPAEPPPLDPVELLLEPFAEEPWTDPLPWEDPLPLFEPRWFDALRLLGRARHALLVSVPVGDGLRLNAVLAFERLPTLFALHGALLTAAAGIAVAAVAWFALSGLTRPLAALARAADDLGRGRPVPRLPERGPEEVRTLVRAFNRMHERLERLLRDRAQVLAAIGHDLKTPLTGLRLRAEFVEDEDTRNRILAAVEEIRATVEAALAFLRAEHADEPVRPVDVGALVASVVDDLAERGDPAEATVPAEPVVVPMRAGAVRRALRNLVENAIRYGHRARVRIESEAGEVRIHVDDDGPGIPEARMEAVFEPFVRLETSRSRTTGGSGLGLAIARTVARAHGGDVRLANRPGGGLRATLILPR